MKLRSTAIVWLLPLLLTGCLHKAHQQQVQTTAPPVDAVPVQPPSEVKNPPAIAPVPNPPTPSTPAPTTSQTKPPIKHPRPVKSTAKPAAKTLSASSAPAPSVSVSAIGQLTSDDSIELRKQTVDAIAAIEQGLNRIDRIFDNQELKTAAQLSEYLKRAKAALNSGDVDGAHTLTAKARLLLNELNR